MEVNRNGKYLGNCVDHVQHQITVCLSSRSVLRRTESETVNA